MSGATTRQLDDRNAPSTAEAVSDGWMETQRWKVCVYVCVRERWSGHTAVQMETQGHR